jgi:DNA-binding HxlR family transcriptional regulator
MESHRSLCPVNLTIETIGDKWTLLILRDMIFHDRRHFNELLRLSPEKIASNILRDRLSTLEKKGLITKTKGAEDLHKQKITYSLTRKSIDLLPIMQELINWSAKYEPVDKIKYKPALDFRSGGQKGINVFRKKLIKEHIN